MPITVLIVDDHPSFRVSARRMLEAAGYDVVGEAPDGNSGLAAVRCLRPQVVLLDVQLPGIDGFAVADTLALGPAPPAVVLVSSRGRQAYRAKLAATSARGFLTKEEFSGECLASLLR